VFPRAARTEGPERLPSLRPPAAGRRALTSHRVARLLVAVLACGLVAGCGGDEEPEVDTPTTFPELTVPRTEEVEPPATQTQTTPPEPTETVPPQDDGGAPAPQPEPPPDAPENDTPPPPDTPAERFEEFCNDNPGACG
jgi:hypothetical protein